MLVWDEAAGWGESRLVFSAKFSSAAHGATDVLLRWGDMPLAWCPGNTRV